MFERSGRVVPAEMRAPGSAPRTRAVLAATAMLVILGAPLAGARTGDNLREGVRNGTTSGETEIIADIRTSTGAKGGFAMRMSNLSSTGGGFVNGCRASAAAASKPCYRASNLSDGRAFEFNTNNGLVAGTITAGAGGDTKKPFTTNATGVATGLNADRVDSLDAAQIIASARAKTGLDADTLDGKDSTAFLGKTEQAADADTLDGRQGTDYLPFYAVVGADGVLVQGVGVEAVERQAPGSGFYFVRFTDSLAGRPLSATIVSDGAGDAQINFRYCVTSMPLGLNNGCGAAFNNQRSVFVNTENSAGANGDEPFMLSIGPVAVGLTPRSAAAPAAGRGGAAAAGGPQEPAVP